MMEYSVIIPAYNSERTIARCITSILNSEFRRNLELIVVDDASLDNTIAIAKELGAKVIEKTECEGPATARNIGATYAKGNMLVFVDSDVLLYPDTLQKIDIFFNQERESIAISCKFDPRCEMTDFISRYKHLYMCYWLNQHRSFRLVFTSAFAIKKDVFERVGGFNDKARVLEDELFRRTLLNKGYRFSLGEQIFVKHLHKYSIFSFIREEFRRSRTFILIESSKIAKSNVNSTLSMHMVSSMLLFPLFMAGAIFSYANFMFFLIILFIFYAVNFGFLRFCKKILGIKFMLQAAFLIPTDCLLGYIGALFGVLDFFRGERI